MMDIFDSVEFVVPAMRVEVKTKIGRRKTTKRNLNGTPVYDYRIFAKERPRFGKGFVYNNPNTTKFEKHIRQNYPTNHMGYLGCRVYNEKEPCVRYNNPNECKKCKSRRKNLGIEIQVFLRDARHIDLDNILKIVLDSLEKVCFYDDTQFAIKHIELVPNSETEYLGVKIYAFNTYFHKGTPVGLYTLKNLPVEFALAYVKDLWNAKRPDVQISFIEWVKRVEDRKQVLEFIKELSGVKNETIQIVS